MASESHRPLAQADTIQEYDFQGRLLGLFHGQEIRKTHCQ